MEIKNTNSLANIKQKESLPKPELSIADMRTGITENLKKIYTESDRGKLPKLKVELELRLARLAKQIGSLNYEIGHNPEQIKKDDLKLLEDLEKYGIGIVEKFLLDPSQNAFLISAITALSSVRKSGKGEVLAWRVISEPLANALNNLPKDQLQDLLFLIQGSLHLGVVSPEVDQNGRPIRDNKIFRYEIQTGPQNPEKSPISLAIKKLLEKQMLAIDEGLWGNGGFNYLISFLDENGVDIENDYTKKNLLDRPLDRQNSLTFGDVLAILYYKQKVLRESYYEDEIGSRPYDLSYAFPSVSSNDMTEFNNLTEIYENNSDDQTPKTIDEVPEITLYTSTDISKMPEKLKIFEEITAYDPDHYVYKNMKKILLSFLGYNHRSLQSANTETSNQIIASEVPKINPPVEELNEF